MRPHKATTGCLAIAQSDILAADLVKKGQTLTFQLTCKIWVPTDAAHARRRPLLFLVRAHRIFRLFS